MADKTSNNSKRPRWLRWVSYFMGLLLALILIIFFVLYGLLYSETGSRWALNKAQQWLPLTIQQNSGTMAEELSALNLEYRQEGLVINVNRLHYRISDINWWQRRLVFDFIRIGRVDIQLSENQSSEKTPLPPPEDIELPLSITLNELFVEQVRIKSEGIAYGPLLAQTSLNDGVISIANLQLLDSDIRLKTAGSVALNNRWLFNLDTQWTYVPEKVSGRGEVTGDITALTLQQNVHANNEYAQGEAVIDAEVTLYPDLLFDADINSDRLLIPSANNDQFKTTFKDIAMTAEGTLSDYHIKMQAHSSQTLTSRTTAVDKDNQKQTKTTHHNNISLVAQGDRDQLNIDSLVIDGDFGRFDAQSNLIFLPQLQIKASFNSEAFNPQWLLSGWPGQLNGSGQLTAAKTDTGNWHLALSEVAIEGRLKNQSLNLTADASVHNETLEIKPLNLSWGDNQVALTGQLNLAEQTADHQLAYDIDISQPQLFLADLSGQIQSQGTLSGSLEKLAYDVDLSATTLEYQDNTIDTLTVKGDGQWPADLQVDILAGDIESAQQSFPKLQLSLHGSQQEHRLKADIQHNEINTRITLAGGWIVDQNLWRGQIESHDIRLNNSDMIWRLQQATDMVLGAEIKLSSACWQSIKGQGEACLNLDIDTNDELSVTGQLQLANLQMALFQGFLPRDLKLGGYIRGTADINYQHQALTLDADLKTDQGTLDYRQGRENSYHTQINTATLNAHQAGGITEIKTVIELDDGSFLEATSQLSDSVGSNWPNISADIKGRLKNSRFLVALSPDLEQLQGAFSLSGQVSGVLNRPAIDLKLQQQSGFLILRQTGSRLTNIDLSVNSSQPGRLQLTASADSDSGSLTAGGELNLPKAADWSFQGNINGTDFRLLTLPELMVNINPELNIEASPQAIHITGQLSLPMAKVNIKNLPPSAETTSADVVIHRPQQEEQDSVASIPVHYDIKTETIEPVDIQLMGLQAKMAGQLRVYDNRQQPFAEGRLNITEGFYKLYGQRLDIERGELIFNGPINNPAIDVKAVRESDDGTVTAGILINGTVNRLNTTLFSEPAMSQLAVLSYLTTGRGLNESGGGTSGEQLAQAAILLGLKRGDSVFSQLQNAFGIDVLTIKQGANNEDSYIEAGQNIGDDLYVGYSQGLFNRLGFWILRYKINDALRLETTQGENQTVDLIYIRKKE